MITKDACVTSLSNLRSGIQRRVEFGNFKPALPISDMGCIFSGTLATSSVLLLPSLPLRLVYRHKEGYKEMLLWVMIFRNPNPIRHYLLSTRKFTVLHWTLDRHVPSPL